jgi:hypothetical protein
MDVERAEGRLDDATPAAFDRCETNPRDVPVENIHAMIKAAKAAG